MAPFRYVSGIDPDPYHNHNPNLSSGKWRFLKNLLEIWSRNPDHSHKLIVRLQQGFSTVEAFYAYKASDPTFNAAKSPIQEYLRKVGYIYKSDIYANLSDFVFSYTIPKNSWKFGDETLFECQFQNGMKYYMTSSEKKVCGPFLEKKEVYEEFKKEFAKVVWGNNDLELTLANSEKLQLGALGTPDIYISIPTKNSPWAHLESLSKRCKAFLGANLSRKILLHGPPGTGKTTLARQLSTSLGKHTLRIDPEALDSSGIDYISGFISHLSPGVVLFDDLDRNPRVKKLLHYLESDQFKGIIIGTVNTLETLDPALLRPGRFDEVLYVGEPDISSRREIIKYYCDLFGVVLDPNFLVSCTEGFSPADLKEILKCVSIVGVEHIESEIHRVSMQRDLYKGNKCAEYFLGGSGLLDNKEGSNGLEELEETIENLKRDMYA